MFAVTALGRDDDSNTHKTLSALYYFLTPIYETKQRYCDYSSNLLLLLHCFQFVLSITGGEKITGASYEILEPLGILKCFKL
ncbi:hypothetical protein VNO77_08066 [Canavalia gladiata]|uniref:Uncharacterized protein n=1 Tax=Canavalia gladiata TaxID=3824 RepID=A0AAN9QTN0_CANGL